MGLVNENQIKTIFEIDRSGELFRKLLSIFETDIPVHIANLETSLKAEDYSNAKKYSHSIKSSSLNMGAAELAILAGDMEQADLRNGFNANQITEIKKCFEYSVAELKKFPQP